MPSRLLVATMVTAALVACGSEDASAIDVTSTETECRVARTTLDAGKTTFSIRNDGKRVTEVYVYKNGTEVVTEKEDIGPGTSAKLAVTLAPGSYEIACKPGMQGNGIRTPITVR